MRRSQAAATSSCRNTCTTWPAGTRCPTEAQERIIGRTKLSDIELDDAVKPSFAHNALTTIVENGKEIKILATTCRSATRRRASSAPTSSATARSPRVTEQMLTNMFVGSPPGNYDRLLDFSRAVTGTLFFVPSATFLDDVTPTNPRHAADPATPEPARRSSATARSASAHSKESRHE